MRNVPQEVKLGDVAYWFEESYPYVIQRGPVVEIERSERLVRNKLQMKVLRVKVKCSRYQNEMRDLFYLTEKEAAEACRSCLETERYYGREGLKKIDHALECMDQIIKGKGKK